MVEWTFTDKVEDEPNYAQVDAEIGNLKNAEIVYHLREYVAVMRDEPAGQLYLFSKLYHDLNRILGNEE